MTPPTLKFYETGVIKYVVDENSNYIYIEDYTVENIVPGVVCIVSKVTLEVKRVYNVNKHSPLVRVYNLL